MQGPSLIYGGKEKVQKNLQGGQPDEGKTAGEETIKKKNVDLPSCGNPISSTGRVLN